MEAGAIHYIQKLFRKGEAQPEAVTVLMELSEKEEFAEKIGNTSYCIPFLVSLLQNINPEISLKAEKVVENLSSNTHFVIKMAEVGYFLPFLTRFNQGEIKSLSQKILSNFIHLAPVCFMQLNFQGMYNLHISISG